MEPLKMNFLLKMGIFHCYVSLPEGNYLSEKLLTSRGVVPQSGKWKVYVGIPYLKTCNPAGDCLLLIELNLVELNIHTHRPSISHQIFNEQDPRSIGT